MKSVILVRVSTLSQDYEAQKKDLIAYAKSLGSVNEYIIEDKESAIKLSEEERNGLNQMKDWIKNHPDYKDVFVWEISRLARSEKVLHSIKEYFLENRIQLHIYDKKYKLLNDDGTENQETGLLFSLYAYFAASEVKIKMERFKRAKRLNAELGKYNGSKIKFGYKLDENKYVVPDEADAKTVRDIFKMYATGKYSIKQVTKEFNLRGVNLPEYYISEMLSFTGYIGYTNYDDSRRSHRKYIPIIDKELYQKVQEVKIANSIVISKSKRYYFCNKIIKCPICGNSYIFNGGTYTCYKYKMEKSCDYCVAIDSKWCDILVWYIALKSHKKFLSIDIEEKNDSIWREIITLDKKIIHVQNDINHIRKKIDRANLLFVNMKINEKQYKSIEDSIALEISQKNKEIEQYETERSNKEILLNSLSNYQVEISNNLSLKEMKDIVTRYVYKIFIYREKRNNCVADRLDIFYYKVDDNDGDLIHSRNTWFFYPYRKSARFEYENETIDNDIFKTCGKTIDAIVADERRYRKKK